MNLRRMKEKNVGSSFDNWLREEGSYEEATRIAIKRVLARQLAAAMPHPDPEHASESRRRSSHRTGVREDHS